MSQAVAALSLWVVVAGIVAAAGVAARAGVRAGVPVLLDFLLAAGLLRLSSRLAWDAIATVAVVIGIRHVLSFGIRTRPAAEAEEPSCTAVVSHRSPRRRP